MVAMISIGIQNGGGKLAEIPCAYEDAKRIYEVFDKVLGNNLKRSASVCAKDITAIECRALISALSLAMEEKDTVVFFSAVMVLNRLMENCNWYFQIILMRIRRVVYF